MGKITTIGLDLAKNAFHRGQVHYTPSTGRIYESNPVPVINATASCKMGGDHIRIHSASYLAIRRNASRLN